MLVNVCALDREMGDNEVFLLDTSSFRAISAGERSAKNTSASVQDVSGAARATGGDCLPSRRITASHSLAISNTFLIFGPRKAAFVPRSSA